MTHSNRTLDAHYENQRLADVYDAGNGWSIDRDFYLSLAGTRPKRILDIGCGTGLLCDAYAAHGHIVTGTEPAASMLNVARKKPSAKMIDWVQSTAQSFSSPHRFDLIIMTGHAFQVLLSEVDVQMTFSVMRDHLAKGGRVVFETRNPSLDWLSRWNRTTNLVVKDQTIRIERKVLKYENDRIQFETHYQFPEEILKSRSVLRFWHLDEITKLLSDNGLRAEAIYGDWKHNAFLPDQSEEIILVAKCVDEP